MAVFSIEPPIREMMQGLREHERLLYEKLREVQSPTDFRAVMQIRAVLDRMRDEMIEASLAQGERRRRMIEQLELYERPPAARILRSRWTG
jgi:hypothetical protein